MGPPELNERQRYLDPNTHTFNGHRVERDRDLAMTLDGHRRGLSTRGLIADRVPVSALPVLVCRLGVIVSATGPLNPMTVPLRVDMCKRGRSAGGYQHQREHHRCDAIGHCPYADPRGEPLSTCTVSRSDSKANYAADDVDGRPDQRGVGTPGPSVHAQKNRRSELGRRVITRDLGKGHEWTFMSKRFVLSHTIDGLSLLNPVIPHNCRAKPRILHMCRNMRIP